MLIVFLSATADSLVAQTPPQQSNARRPPSTYNDPVVEIDEDRSQMKIVERFAKVVQLPEPRKIARVDGFDPDVVGVTALKYNQIRVQAITPGVTTLLLLDENGKTYSVEIFVMGDVRHLQAYIDRFFPHSAVEAVAVRDSVVLKGWVQQPQTITELVEIAQEFYPRVLNQMKVGGAQQVQLKVKVMEVQRSKIRQLGFNFLYANKNGFLSSTPGELAQIAGLSIPFGGPPEISVNSAKLVDSTILGGIVDNNNIFQGFLEALKSESLLKILAEPTLVATNGRPANLLAGGEFPIVVPQSLGTTTIEWREFGIRLEAVPIMLGNGRVRLELQPEVSERDFSNAVTIGGLTVPGLTTRRVNTQVEMKFGETFVLAGLLSTRNISETDKVLFLGELPWIGALFRRVRYVENETELVIMVTPELVSPMRACEVPPGGPGLFTDIPTDHELFIDGMIEVPSYGDRCLGCDPVAPGAFGNGIRHSYPQPVDDGSANPVITPGGDQSPPPAPGSTFQQGPAPEPVPATSLNGAPSSRTASGRFGRPGLIEPRRGLIEPTSALR